MWFTVAFITYPIALLLVYKAYKNYKSNGNRRLFFACLIFITPMILLVFERNNLKEINSELNGIYISSNDTLFINNNRFVLKGNLNKTIGNWELLNQDELSIILKDEKEKTIELKIIYEKGKIKLADKTKTYTKLDII